MNDSTIEAAATRVEQAPLAELVSISVDDLQAQLDSYLDTRVDPRSLYRRWEDQHWSVFDLDLSVDVQHWAALDDGVRAVVRRILTLFFIGEQAVTDALSPIVYAAPRDDERIFLATQVADEARHATFFDRFFAEVMELPGGLQTALDTVGPEGTAGVRKVFDDHLATAIDRVRREPRDMTAWAQAVVTYHLIIEGYLALTGMRNLLTFTRATGFMPGFRTGFTAVARDESRHIGFGVLALRRRIRENPEIARTIVLKLLELSEPAVATAVDPSFIIRPPGGDSPEQREADASGYAEGRAYAQGQLGKRIRAVGLSESAVGEVLGTFDAHFDRMWELHTATA